MRRLHLLPILMMMLCLVAGCGGQDRGTGFDRVLKSGDLAFHLRSPGVSVGNTVSVRPSGLEIVNREERREIDGTVTDAWIADLDGNGWPEVYVFVTSGGSGAYGSLVGFAVNNGKSMSDIYLEDLMADPELATGYMGHDVFSLEEGRLVRRFPLFAEGDANAAPSGGMRRIEYALTPGEAAWQLRVSGSRDES